MLPTQLRTNYVGKRHYRWLALSTSPVPAYAHTSSTTWRKRDTRSSSVLATCRPVELHT